MPDSTAGGAAETGIPALAVIDAEGTVIGWTRAAQELLGYRPGDILDRPATLLLMPADQAGMVGGGPSEDDVALLMARTLAPAL
ncbi:PAS domain-containing protein [Nonomuraea sp. B12E4]|uniref:PAS domain-containing protein n=1 Tax=Nonomuraea sp. B12E4 TaxID=3153564 RepID=UPI00325E3236